MLQGPTGRGGTRLREEWVDQSPSYLYEKKEGETERGGLPVADQEGYLQSTCLQVLEGRLGERRVFFAATASRDPTAEGGGGEGGVLDGEQRS